jgi:hypothetical protein
LYCPCLQKRLAGEQTAGLTLAMKGALFNEVIYTSGCRNFMPAMIAFPRMKEKTRVAGDAPPGRAADCPPSEWTQKEILLN